jgi:cobalt-zinc-cadmium efflux system membrane fusion protein
MARFVSRFVVAVCALGVLGGMAWWGIEKWRDRQQHDVEAGAAAVSQMGGTAPVRLSAQARENLNLVAKPVQPGTYWRTVEFPGVIVDRPGITDRGVVAPITGVVTQIHAFPGDAIEPGAPLFTLRLTSEPLYNSQLELYKSLQDVQIAQRELDRISSAAATGAIPRARVIEVENQIQRANAMIDSYRQDLRARGLTPEQVASAEAGHYVTETVVPAPAISLQPAGTPGAAPFSFEVQSLAVELGRQVAAGEVVCHLADYRSLLIEGRGFKDDMPLVQTAVRNAWDAQVEFELPAAADWPPLPERLPIHHMANTLDPETRAFSFFIELDNQSQPYERDGATRLLWRFRPGQHLRLRVPVEKLDNVFVVPQQAIVWEGPEAFVFRQNGEFFDRKPVHVLCEDRTCGVIANDGSIKPGFYIAQGAAASLNRVMKSQSQQASGAPPGMHVHPDGTTHATH